MKVFLTAFCLILSVAITAQTFQWDNAQPTNTSQTTAKAVTPANDIVIDESGRAHFYPDYYEGNTTAFGEVFHHNLMTAAHRNLPEGTIVKVTRMDNGLDVTVRINDRGAYCDGCAIDLSAAAAKEIDLRQNGQIQVGLTVMGYSKYNPTSEVVEYTQTQQNWTAQTVAADHQVARNTAEYAQPQTQPESQWTARTVAADHQVATSVPSNTKSTDYLPEFQTNTTAQPVLQARGLTAVPVLIDVEEEEKEEEKNEIEMINFPISPFSVQLGSYRQLSNAEGHVKKLQDLDFENVFILQEITADESLLHRVIVAPFTRMEDAEDYIDDLDEYYQMEGLVFQTLMVEIEE